MNSIQAKYWWRIAQECNELKKWRIEGERKGRMRKIGSKKIHTEKV